MKKNRGFTLVELLAVIAIIVVIMLMVGPKILDIIQKSRKDSYDEQVRRFENAAELYITNNSNELSDSGTTNISLWELDDKGLIDLPVKNPLTGQNFNPDMTVVTITETAPNIFSYSFVEESLTKYGNRIYHDYETIYATWTDPDPIETLIYGPYYDGNYGYGYNVYTGGEELSSTILNVQDDPTYKNQNIYAGQHTYNLAITSTTNRWLTIKVRAGGDTTGASFSNFKIVFNDNAEYTLKEAVENGYIEPLVICVAAADATTYLWYNMDEILDGGSSSVANYPVGFIAFKVKTTAVKGFSLYANKDYSTSYDGLRVNQFGTDYDLSLIPFP